MLATAGGTPKCIYAIMDDFSAPAGRGGALHAPRRHYIAARRAAAGMERVAVLAITRGGLSTARRLIEAFPSWTAHAPAKLSDGAPGIAWFDGPAAPKMGELFRGSDALVCLFSLGAVIRLAAPHMRDKKTDPAVVVIDEGARYAISALSGHLGGANELAARIGAAIGAEPVITTAADVKGTIAVDMVGRRFGWEIDGGADVTRASACMVNGERVGLYQDAGRTDWWEGGSGGGKGAAGRLPPNVERFDSLAGLAASGAAAMLVITDRIVDAALLSPPSSGGSDGGAPGPAVVVYRPRTLTVGIGLHRTTSRETVVGGIRDCLAAHSLSPRSVARLASIRKDAPVAGLEEAAAAMSVPLVHIDPAALSRVDVPNPSEVVRAFEGTASVSEAAALAAAAGAAPRGGGEPASLAVEKQKYPPDLTVAVARSAG